MSIAFLSNFGATPRGRKIGISQSFKPISAGGGGAITIVTGRLSTANVPSGGQFPSSWTVTNDPTNAAVIDGNTSTDAGLFHDKFGSVELSDTYTGTVQFRVYGSMSDLCWGYSTNGTSWTVVQASQTSYTSGTLTSLGNITLKYFGCSTGNGSTYLKEIQLVLT